MFIIRLIIGLVFLGGFILTCIPTKSRSDNNMINGTGIMINSGLAFFIILLIELFQWILG